MRAGVRTAVGVLAMLGGAGGALPLGGAPVGAATSGPAARNTTTTTLPDGLVPANPRLADRVVLDTRHVPAGHVIHGTLVVHSTASHPVNLTRTCRPAFAVVVHNAAVQQMPGFAAACSSEPFVVKPGTNRYPVIVTTTSFGCLAPGGMSAASSTPLCTDGKPPPLPPGRYHTVLVGSGDLALPQPPPVVVTLTGAR